ncbi:MAG TPA: IPT/TIG domain-containing protein, partial [Thermoanaerobaculia bacterium]|nr:IPT/TIG domain-containing protein [Thermoanaerobaculia bacterium]
MTKFSLRTLGICISLVLSLTVLAQQKTILFDAAHAQTAGNADWTLDEDSCGTAQRLPTPDQAGITSSTAETYWSGAFSAMGVDLVKKGFHVESLPVGARISYGDGTNAQDLSHYNVFVIPEPNIAFTSTEITAIRNFVQNGGGLFMISDHAGADRNNDGKDAAGIFNLLMGSPSVFGITFDDNSSDTSFGWFDNHPDDNYTNDTTSPIVWTGAFGVPSSGRGLGLFGSTSMTVSGAATAHIWKTGVAKGSTTGVTFATSTYGTGRVAAVGDSSTGEDATNSCSHTTYLGYNDPSYDNGLIYANAVAWLANGSGSGGSAPTVTSFSPTSGGTGTSVTITGTNFTGTTAVKFNGQSATFTVVSSTSITATVPNCSSTGTISVTNATGTGTSSGTFTVTGCGSSAPTVTSFSPTSGATGTSVTITGTNFTGATAVKFNGQSATTFTVVSSTSITATVPNCSSTGTIAVTNASGTGTSTGTFTVTGCGSTQLLGNPGFETGSASPWVASASVLNNSTSEPAHGGSWDAWLDGYGTTHTDTLYQQVAIPSGKTSATLTFYLHIDTAETTTTTAYD